MTRTKENDFFTFVRCLWSYLLYLRHVFASLLFLLTCGGLAVCVIEDLEWGEGMYFAFITGLTIGYGDISPETFWGRLLSVLIGIIGMLLTGLTIAVANRALHDACINDENVE